MNCTFLEWPCRVKIGSVISLFMPSSGISHNFMLESSDAVATYVSKNGYHSLSRIAPEWPLMRGGEGGSRKGLLKSKTKRVPPPDCQLRLA